MFGKYNNDLNKSLKGSFLLSIFTWDGVKYPISNRGQSTINIPSSKMLKKFFHGSSIA